MVRSRLFRVVRLRGLREWQLFIGLCLTAPFVPLLMRRPLPSISRLLTRYHSRVARGLEPERVVEVVETAQQFGHPIVRRGCLTRGVSLFALLHDRPGDWRLCFGMGGDADDHFGHCWIERDGEAFLDPVERPAERFPPLFAFPM